MMPDAPRIVAWTDHALAKAQLLGITRIDVEDAVLEGHSSRSKNTGAADWLLPSAGWRLRTTTLATATSSSLSSSRSGGRASMGMR
jgi:hypothetical protein